MSSTRKPTDKRDEEKRKEALKKQMKEKAKQEKKEKKEQEKQEKKEKKSKKAKNVTVASPSTTTSAPDIALIHGPSLTADSNEKISANIRKRIASLDVLCSKQVPSEYIDKGLNEANEFKRQLFSLLGVKIEDLSFAIDVYHSQSTLTEDEKKSLVKLHALVSSVIKCDTLSQKLRQIVEDMKTLEGHQRESISISSEIFALSLVYNVDDIRAECGKVDNIISSKNNKIAEAAKVTGELLTVASKLNTCLNKPTLQPVSAYNATSPAMFAAPSSAPQPSAPNAANPAFGRK